MARSHLLPTGKHKEAGKPSLLNSIRQRVTTAFLVTIGTAALVSFLIQPSSQAFANQSGPAGQNTSATQVSTDSQSNSFPMDSQTSQTSTSQDTLAIQSKPAINRSYYMTSGRTDIANRLGCAQGRADRSDHQLSHVILDFGAQAGNGSGAFFPGSSTFISNGQIERAVEAFAQGYSSCVGRTSRVTLGLDIGTNNSGSVSFANGQRWARLVRAVRSFDSAHHLSAHVIVFGANDIESWCGNSGCASPSQAIQWARGYHSGGVGNFVNFGSLDGCPPAGGCSGRWTQADYWSVSNRSVAWVVPQIYNQVGTQASQWESLDLFSVQHHHSALVFLGPLDQHDIQPGCCPGTNNTAQQAWNQLWSALHSHRSTSQRLLFSIEIRWEPRSV